MKTKNILAVSIYSLVTLFLLFEMALQVSPSVMTNDLMRDFKIDALKLGVMVAFYFYSYTLMQIPVGLLFDRFNARIIITLAILMCSTGSLFFGFTHMVALGALGRFLMGIGSAFAFVGVLVVAARWFPGKYFAFLVGMAQFLASIGALMGELPLAMLLEVFSWRTMMILLGVIGFILALLCSLIVRDNPDSERHIPHRHHLFNELKDIIKTSQTWWIALYAFCGWGPVAAFAALWGVPFLQVRFDISVTSAAFLMSMVWVGVGTTSPIIGYLSDKLKKRCILLSFCALIGFLCSCCLLYVPISFNIAFFLLFGIGLAAGGQLLTFALVKDNNRNITTGTAIGLNNMAVVAGGAIFQPLVGFILNMFWSGSRSSSGVPIYTTLNYEMGLIIVPICFLVGFIVSVFFIKETHCIPKYDTSPYAEIK